MNIQALTYEQYMGLQSVLRTRITPCLKYCDLQLTDIEYSIRDGKRIPVLFREEKEIIGMMVLELDTDAIHITTLSGSFSDYKGWKDYVLLALTKLARQYGKSRLQCNGRASWTRALRSMGAEQINDLTVIKVD